MPYYRHKTEKIIYHLTDEPFVAHSTHKGKPSGGKITGELHTTFADNPTDPNTHLLTKKTYKAAVTPFEAKDTETEALAQHFLRWAPADTIEIDRSEYQRLKLEYSEATKE